MKWSRPRSGSAVASKPWSAPGVVQGADQSRKFGADRSFTLTNPAFAKYAPGVAQAWRACETGGHRCIVFAASATGKDLAPRVAAKLGVAVAPISQISQDGGAIVVTRPFTQVRRC